MGDYFFCCEVHRSAQPFVQNSSFTDMTFLVIVHTNRWGYQVLCNLNQDHINPHQLDADYIQNFVKCDSKSNPGADFVMHECLDPDHVNQNQSDAD